MSSDHHKHDLLMNEGDSTKVCNLCIPLHTNL